MQLHSAPKYQGRGLHRVMPPEETFRRVRPLLPTLGITRLADITGLDRLGIPTYSAVVPDSADVLSVYNGKGISRAQARVGAVMEAIERYSALRMEKELITGTYNRLARERPAVRPSALILRMHPEYHDDCALAWVEGYDLLGQQPVLVPAQAVTFVFQPAFGHPCYTHGTTNGLAAGNRLEEAVCHALMELIERDAWTLAELRARYLPLLQREPPQDSGDGAADPEWADDADLFPDVDLSTAGPTITRLVAKFRRAGVELRVKNITSDLGIPCVLATAVEPAGPGFPLAHLGLGTHPDATIALIRALTEVAQSRAVDIQGVREDLALSIVESHEFPAHTKRVQEIRPSSWYFRPSGRQCRFDEIPSYAHADVLADINLMLARLQGAGVEQVVAVDLTRPEGGIPVVRMLAPGLESWAADHGRFGWRAAAVCRQR